MDVIVYPFSRRLGSLLRAAGIKLATAESCTAGGLGWEITRVPGSAEWFERGFITYSNESKANLLGVKAKSLKQYGAVSEQVAREMALGALKNSDANIALSVTGVAGPGGGTAEKPIGLVWFGLAQDNRQCECRKVIFDSGRNHIRSEATIYALKWLIEVLAAKTS
jgi:nicotinamide-nucleotide amidase